MSDIENDFGVLRHGPVRQDEITSKLQQAALDAAIQARQDGRSPSLAAAEVGLIMGLQLGQAARQRDESDEVRVRAGHHHNPSVYDTPLPEAVFRPSPYSRHEIPQLESPVNAQGEIRLSPKFNP